MPHVLETLEITGLAHGGDGVGRIEGQVCFVPYALPGDVVRVRVTRRARGVLWASIEGIVERSPHRTGGDCPVFGRCGGCTWLHFAYPAQAEWKQRIVRDCFERIAGLEVETAWVDVPELRLGYRTRAEFHGARGRWGFFARGTHDIMDIPSCPLCHPRLNEAFATLRQLSVTQSVELTANPEGDEVLAWARPGHIQLKKLFPGSGAPAARGERAGFVFDGVPVVNGAFSQSSLLLNRALRRVVDEAVGDASAVLDLYCGSGNFSLALADKARVLGIDHDRAAIGAAQSMGRGEFRLGDEAAFRAAVDEAPWDVVLLDPPRAGAKPVAQAVAESAARAVVYVSCDPATLARDVKTLTARGWRAARVTVVDMFPNTAHIETVCRFER